MTSMVNDQQVMSELAELALIRPKAPPIKKPVAPIPEGVCRGGFVLFEDVTDKKYIVREVSGISRARGELFLHPDKKEEVNRRHLPFGMILFAATDGREVRSVAAKLNRASCRYRERQKNLQAAFLKEFQDIIGKS